VSIGRPAAGSGDADDGTGLTAVLWPEGRLTLGLLALALFLAVLGR
jgi:hypothetical protein